MKRISGFLSGLLAVGFMHVATVKAESAPSPPRESNGLALTPPMGWNSWNKFACTINETIDSRRRPTPWSAPA